MADLNVKDRLQPSLFDRLRDDDPWNKVEGRDKRVLSMTQLRQAVLRDLVSLLNTQRSHDPDIDALQYVRTSVLNFGVRGLSGVDSDSLEMPELEDRFYKAIVRFEPRVVKGTLRIRASSGLVYSDSGNIIIEIIGQLWAQPVPETLYIKTSLDLESGELRPVEGTK